MGGESLELPITINKVYEVQVMNRDTLLIFTDNDEWEFWNYELMEGCDAKGFLQMFKPIRGLKKESKK